MKKKLLVCTIVGSLIFTLAGCANKDSENYKAMLQSKNEVLPIYEENDKEISDRPSDLKELKDIDAGYEIEEFNSTADPNGVVCLKDSIILSDKKEDVVVQKDYSGKVIRKIGKTGNGEGEFISPAAIKIYAHKIYVLDQGNNRVQIFNTKLKYLESIELANRKKDDPEYVPQKMAVNKDGIYVTGMSLHKPVIDKYSNGEHKEIGKNFIGALAICGSDVYGINSMVHTYDQSSDTFGAVTNAPEWLFTIKNGKLKKVCKLPFGFGLYDFVIHDKEIICVSVAGASIYSLKWNGEYKETLARISGLEDEENPQIDGNEKGEYFVVMPAAKKIYRIYKK